MSLRIVERHFTLLIFLLAIAATSQAKAQNAVNSAAPAGAAGFDELKARVAEAQSQTNANEAVSGLIEEWVSHVGIDRLSVEQVQWCLEQALPNAKHRNAFSVVWTGLLTPQRTGTYTFSVSPINVNRQFGRNPVNHTIIVIVAEAKVVNVGPMQGQQDGKRFKTRPALLPDVPMTDLTDEWKWKGDPIELQAGQPVPIRVEMRYECQEPNPADSPSAILCWEGPGVQRQSIPVEAFSLAEGSGKGLRAQFSLQDGSGPPRTVVQSAHSIDFAWSTPADVAPSAPELVARLTEHLWQLVTLSEFLSECASGRRVHPYIESERRAQYLTSEQRREFVQLLTDNEQMLQRIDANQLLALFRSLRFGAEDDAIDMLGTWMQLNVDITPKITVDFFRENRQAYAELAILLARQQQGAHRSLQDRYLEMPDGRCALPVAYTLSYGYRTAPAVIDKHKGCNAMNAPLPEWIQLLESKANNTSLNESQRINWLIARCQSVEPRKLSANASTCPPENYLAGMNWLTEAHLLTQKDALKARLYIEELARFAVAGREQKAAALLTAVKTHVPESDTAQWSVALNAVKQHYIDLHFAQREARRTAYSQTLRNHLNQAVQRGDSDSVERINSILGEMSEK